MIDGHREIQRPVGGRLLLIFIDRDIKHLHLSHLNAVIFMADIMIYKRPFVNL